MAQRSYSAQNLNKAANQALTEGRISKSLSVELPLGLLMFAGFVQVCMA